MAQVPNRIRRHIQLQHGKRKLKLTINPMAIQQIGGWNSSKVVQIVESFSVAFGGPSEFFEAMAYWSADERFGAQSVIVESAIWWHVGSFFLREAD
jgi:succinate-acetate transporter protein